MEILRKTQKEMLELKNTVTETKKVTDGPISRMDITEKRISEAEDMSIETSKTEKQGKHTEKKEKNI